MGTIETNHSYTILLNYLLFSGLSQCWICSPMELAKIRMQSEGEGKLPGSNLTYTSAADCIKKVYAAEGIRGVYKGMGITVVRELPSFGVYFVSYEYLCRGFTPEGTHHCPTHALLLAGGVAGCNSWLCSYPLDVLKTRIQQDGRYIDGKFYYNYKGYMDCIRKSVAQDGYRAFVKGLNPTLARAFVTNAATFPVYTLCVRYLRPGQLDDDETRETLERISMIAQHES